MASRAAATKANTGRRVDLQSRPENTNAGRGPKGKGAWDVSRNAMSMVENAPVNIMCADRDFNIRYINPASTRTLRSIEQYLPVKVDAILGQSIDIFHKNPARQRQILSDPR
ncbi:MAG: PAS domain-containing protein, partial [Polyangiales bacterium]